MIDFLLIKSSHLSNEISFLDAKDIYTIFNNTNLMNSKTIILSWFQFLSSYEFTKLIDSLSGWENIIFRNCTIHTNKDLMLKEDNGVGLGILILLQDWFYSKFPESPEFPEFLKPPKFSKPLEFLKPPKISKPLEFPKPPKFPKFPKFPESPESSESSDFSSHKVLKIW